MQYKITRQSEKDMETFFAEFNDVNDSTMFIEAKLKQDDALRMKKIYRLFDDGHLKKEFNPAKISAPFDLAQYAEEDKDITATNARPYKVQQSTTTIAHFIELNDAKLFVEKKLTADAKQQKDVNYRLLNENQLIEEASQSKHTESGDTSKRSSTTPFATAPKPPGTITTNDEDDD